MIIFWTVRYIDRSTRQFNDRGLLLDTDTLPAATKTAVEFVLESSQRAAILQFRTLFREADDHEVDSAMSNSCRGRFVSVSDYFEDEAGAPIREAELGPILSGDPNAILVPRGAEQHDLDLLLAEQKAVPILEVSVSPGDLTLLGYFVRDCRELATSPLMVEGPGTIARGGSSPDDWALSTAVDDEDIRSFVTIFRRLYMETERANFAKATDTCAAALGDHPRANWLRDAARSFERHLNSPVDLRPFGPVPQAPFPIKRLIDVFLYTQYAHQPDERRVRQFKACLDAVNGQRGYLAWLFLTELWKSSLRIQNTGRFIVGWFERYCECHQLNPDVVPSIRDCNPGVGSIEKASVRRARLFAEKTDQLAVEIWRSRGSPAGGPTKFLHEAREKLNCEIQTGSRPMQ